MVNFSDYRDPNENVSINKRVEQIKYQFETIHEKARDNIKKKQELQKKHQDQSHKVTEDKLEVGQLVTIKALKSQGKLQPRFNGIFKIIGISRNGNYRLETMSGVELKQAFISSKLKKVAENLEEDDSLAYVEIERILKHRKRNIIRILI